MPTPMGRTRAVSVIVITALLALLIWLFQGAIGIRNVSSPVDGLSDDDTAYTAPIEQAPVTGDNAERISLSSHFDVPDSAPAVRGHVRDAGGTPLAGVQIAIRQRSTEPSDRDRGAQFDQPIRETSTDAAGRFAIVLPRDAHAALTFSLAGYRPTERHVRAESIGHDVILERSPRLFGRVVRRDESPVADALVRWSNANGALDTGGTTLTAADGTFDFVGLPWNVNFEVLAPDALPQFLYLRVAWGLSEIVIVVDDGRSESGMVVDAESGGGIGDAIVELWYYRSSFDAAGRRSPSSLRAEVAKSQVDGSFRLRRLPTMLDTKRPEAYLWVTAPGRAPHWKIVRFPETAEQLKVALYRAGSIRGKVVDASGAPLARERVWAEALVQSLCEDGPDLELRRHDTGYGSPMWSQRRPMPTAPWHTERDVFTDSKGEYLLEGIPCPAGGGEVTITLARGRPRVTAVAMAEATAIAPDLVVQSDAFRHWYGIVRDPGGGPIAGATVELGGSRTLSNAEGRFDLELGANVQGRLPLRASASGYARTQRELRPTSDADGQALFCECPVEGLTITLDPAVDLRVSVVDRQDRPVCNAHVQLCLSGALAELKNGGPRASVLGLAYGLTDDRGMLCFTSVPRTCDVLVEYPQSWSREHRQIKQAVDAGSGPLRVVLGTLDVAAGRATLTVRVDDALTGKSVDGLVHVTLASEDATMSRVGQGPELRFEDLSRATWDVTVAAEGLGSRSTSVHLSESRCIEVRLGEGAEVSGIVTCADDALTGPLQVAAQDVARKRFAIARTDRAGRFTFRGMAPGRYLLAVDPIESAAFDRWGRSDRAQRYASLAPIEVVLEAATTARTIALPVVRFDTLRVTVATSSHLGSGTSVWSWSRGILFTVRDEQSRIVYQGGPSELVGATARLVRNLPSGTYRVAVRRQGRLLAERAMTTGESIHCEER